MRKNLNGILETALVAVCMGVLCAPIASAQSAKTPAKEAAAWPADIDTKSGFRLPLPNREDLNEAGKKTYDRGTQPGASVAGLQGPAGVQLYGPCTTEHLSAVLSYLRKEAGYSDRIREIALLTTSRSLDNQFEWTAHEGEALKAGVPQKTIDAIKYKKSLKGIDENDALVIQLGREIWVKHKVSSETFAKAKAVYGPHKLYDLVLLMGNHAETAAVLSTFDMQLHKGDKPLLPIK